jgi:GNAT superfamily N-acetyltransferase
VNIRDAAPADAAAAREVLRASISELCVADHHNDPEILKRWLASKTPENLAAWIADSEASTLLAVKDDVVLAVGAVRNDGEITLNYVSPTARFRGASSALLAALEARAKERGNTTCKLLSTETAHRFYLNRGYLGRGEPQNKFGMSSSYPMSKSI